MQVTFYDTIDDNRIKFAVIISKSNEKWVFCKHKERDTYECPGGRREAGESILACAKRELYEETGAIDFEITPVCVYSVTGKTRVNETGDESFGMLYFAEIKEFEQELHSEIECIKFFEELPKKWTYPLIQPLLIEEYQRRSLLKIVFLDIDGVLNSSLWDENHQDEINQGILIDKEKIKILAILIRKTGARIVLHSGWRNWFNGELNPTRNESAYLVDFLKEEGLSIDDVTPDLTTEDIRASKKFSLVKADEILLWLEQHDNVESWVVLDDLYLHNLEVEEHQVKTDPRVGLTYLDVENAEKILTSKRNERDYRKVSIC